MTRDDVVRTHREVGRKILHRRDQGNAQDTAAELHRLRSANVKLAGALDMIRETLQGGNVDDLLYIINTALEEHRRSKT